MRPPSHPSRREFTLPEVLHALSDPVRLAIVAVLSDGGEHPCASFDFGLSRASLSHHFRVLREAGVTRTRAEGKHRFIRLRREDLDARFPGLMKPLVALARSAQPPSPPRPAPTTQGPTRPPASA
jgi:DNA-binding transcriptional ArsR family regulator